MASTYLQRTNTSGTNTYTFSAWVKLCNPSKTANQWIFTSNDGGLMTRDNSSSSGAEFHFYNSDNNTNYYSGAKRRDASGWYHIVLSSNSGTGTLYVNGETDKTGIVVPNLSTSSNAMQIGRLASSGNDYFNGLMSHVHFIDGTAYTASSFGSTDTTTGEWKINTSPSVTYGSQGFFILKDGNSLTDQSPNTNNFTLGGGTLTKTEDNPSNVFCVLNRLNSDQPTGSVNMQYGNTGFEDGENGSNYSYVSGTLGANSGKFYWETKVIDLAEIDQVGVVLASSSFIGAANSNGLQATTYGGKGCQFSNGYKVGDGSGGAYMGGFSANDIMMIALDLDNNKITFGRNGQWADGSGNANQTYANSTPAYTNLTAGEFYFPAQAKRAGGGNYGTNWYNFGNGYFQTTAVSSEGTNVSGNGIFEYDVPTGFTALSTKGLNL
ncbi:hypothetical protein N9J64_00345 [bacterium]|nr:hypothetical protein [bacterium]